MNDPLRDWINDPAVVKSGIASARDWDDVPNPVGLSNAGARPDQDHEGWGTLALDWHPPKIKISTEEEDLKKSLESYENPLVCKTVDPMWNRYFEMAFSRCRLDNVYEAVEMAAFAADKMLAEREKRRK